MTSPEDAFAAAYIAGATTRELAAEHGIHESTIRHWLRAAGVQMRPRGAKPSAPIAEVVTLRRKHKLSWDQIATATGMSKTSVRRVYRAATGNTGVIDHHKHLTAKQADRLRELYEQVPYSSPGRGRATRSSMEGQRLADQICAHLSAGVTQVEIASLFGHHAAWVRYVAGLAD